MLIRRKCILLVSLLSKVCGCYLVCFHNLQFIIVRYTQQNLCYISGNLQWNICMKPITIGHFKPPPTPLVWNPMWRLPLAYGSLVIVWHRACPHKGKPLDKEALYTRLLPHEVSRSIPLYFCVWGKLAC